jgi:hypothetical protein
MKSLLLGSAAGIVAVASAQAADLPTRKGAPAVQYVQICTITVSGKPVVGFTLPGSDTCMHFTGYVTAQIEGGNLDTNYSFASYVPTGTVLTKALTASSGLVVTPAALSTGNQTATGTVDRNSFGYTTRLNFGFDAVSNTSYGPLVAHAEIQIESGNGFDTTGNSAYVNLAYVTWAGLTAGKAPSFFSFTGGGAGWANFASPDEQGFNQPDLLAYTATFGGGASASIAIQSDQTMGGSGGGTQVYNLGNDETYGGQRWPDLVGNIKISQGWGSAQVAGVLHNVRATAWDGTYTQKTGWAIDAGVSVNIPQFGAGDDVLVTGAYSQNAFWYSGLADTMWGELGDVNGNGQQWAAADVYADGGGIWQSPTAWSVSAEFDHHFTPEFVGHIEGSVGGIEWNNSQAASLVSNSTIWLIGGVLNYDPVKNLDFEFEVFYQDSQTSTPNGWVATPTGTTSSFHGNSNGVAARFEVTRSW